MLKNLVLIGFSFIAGCFVSMYVLTSVRIDTNHQDQEIYTTNKNTRSLYLHANFLSKSEVYICKGPSSKRYHYKKSCRGLKPCSTKIFEVSLSKATGMGRTLCGWED